MHYIILYLGRVVEYVVFDKLVVRIRNVNISLIDAKQQQYQLYTTHYTNPCPLKAE